MWLVLFRKYIIGSKIGLALFYGITFFFAESLAFGFNVRSAVIFGFIGLIGGYAMASKAHKQGRYFMDNLKDEDKFTQMQGFRKLFAEEELPESKSEWVEYREYLDALEESKARLSANYQWWAMAFLFGMFILYLVADGVNFLALVFPIILVVGGNQIIKSKKDLQKIDRLKQRLPGYSEHHRETPAATKEDNWKLP